MTLRKIKSEMIDSTKINSRIEEVKLEIENSISTLNNTLNQRITDAVENFNTDEFVLTDGSSYIDNITIGTRMFNTVVGIGSCAIGTFVTASGEGSLSQGMGTMAYGDNSNAKGSGTTASGYISHAEGNTTTASGDASHSEGYTTIATGTASHAEGSNTNAVGNYSHSEGYVTSSDGVYSHAEGVGSRAVGEGSHAEGFYSSTGTKYAHAKGQYTLASNGTLYTVTSTDDSSKTITLESSTNTIGVNSILDLHGVDEQAILGAGVTSVNGNVITVSTGRSLEKVRYAVVRNVDQKPVYVEGYGSIASGNYSHSEGHTNIASGTYSHAEGYANMASGNISHAEGYGNITSGNYSHAEGYGSVTSGSVSHSEGYMTKATGNYSHAEGVSTIASGIASHSANYGTTASIYASTAIGRYNKVMSGDSSVIVNANNDAFVIGNGTSATNLSNAFRVTFDGKTYGLSAFNSTGADYSEFFEWLDENPNGEDRVGYIVTTKGDRIVKAKSSDNYILGVVSATPSIIGDSYQDDWKHRYMLDEWGRIIYEEQDVPHQELDEEGNNIIVYRRALAPLVNSEWNSDIEYIPREQRKEWSAIGLVGKLYVRDDGTCEVDGFAKVGSVDGEATASQEQTNMRVIERVAPNIIRVFIK